METLGIYKSEFDSVINIYAGLREQYDELEKIFFESEFEFEVPTASGMKKAPIVTTMEALRRDILSYAKDLGLTPHGLLKFDETAFHLEKESKFAQIMGQMLDD